jgi:hypothetical protein
MNKPQDKRYNITFEFKRCELLYDIESLAYVEGEGLAKDNTSQARKVLDIAQGENENLVSRTLSLAHRECVEMLYPYTKSEVEYNAILNDVLTPLNTYTISLSLPAEFSSTSMQLIKELIHRYMVCKVLWEWMGIVKRDSAEYWLAQMEDAKQRIKSSLMYRRGRLRKKQSPF